MGNGAYVGLDVHARSVVAGLIDDLTGELKITRAPHRTDEGVGWLGDLAGPVRVTYEAGPSGFGLARACEAAGMQCLVGRAQPDRGLARRSRQKERCHRRRGPGAPSAPGRAHLGEGARSGRRGRPRSRARPRGRPCRADAGPTPALEAASAPRAGVRAGLGPGQPATRPGSGASASSIPAPARPSRTTTERSCTPGYAATISIGGSASSRPRPALRRWWGALGACAGWAR